jgi:hypothetical protein
MDTPLRDAAPRGEGVGSPGWDTYAQSSTLTTGRRGKMEELYDAVWKSFLSLAGTFKSFPKEGAATKQLCEEIRKRSPDDPMSLARAMVVKFHELTSNGDDHWRKQPFVPSRLNSAGVFESVYKMVTPSVQLVASGKAAQFLAKLQGYFGVSYTDVQAKEVERWAERRGERTLDLVYRYVVANEYTQYKAIPTIRRLNDVAEEVYEGYPELRADSYNRQMKVKEIEEDAGFRREDGIAILHDLLATLGEPADAPIH